MINISFQQFRNNQKGGNWPQQKTGNENKTKKKKKSKNAKQKSKDELSKRLLDVKNGEENEGGDEGDDNSDGSTPSIDDDKIDDNEEEALKQN